MGQKVLKTLLILMTGVLVLFFETFFTNFIFSSISFNLLIIYVVFISLYIDKTQALIFGGVFGLMSDIVSGGIIGINLVLYLAISYFITSVESSIFKDKKYIIAILVLLVSVFYSLISGCVYSLFLTPQPFYRYPLNILVFKPLLNTSVAYVMYSLFEDVLLKLKEE